MMEWINDALTLLSTPDWGLAGLVLIGFLSATLLPLSSEPALLAYLGLCPQNFWLATFAFTVCFVLTLGLSLATRRTKTNEELKGLVYSLTPKLVDEEKSWFLRPAFLGCVLLAVCVVMNIIFW